MLACIHHHAAKHDANQQSCLPCSDPQDCPYLVDDEGLAAKFRAAGGVHLVHSKLSQGALELLRLLCVPALSRAVTRCVLAGWMPLAGQLDGGLWMGVL